jgi:transposase-like protein
MEQPAKTCPKCRSDDYAFRSRKKIEVDPDKGEPAAVETKYRCKACGHEWKVRTVNAEP